MRNFNLRREEKFLEQKEVGQSHCMFPGIDVNEMMVESTPTHPLLHLALPAERVVNWRIGGGGWRSAESRGNDAVAWRVLFSALRLPCRVTFAPYTSQSPKTPKTPKTYSLEISSRSSQLRPLRFRQFPKRFASFSLFVNNIYSADWDIHHIS